MSLSLYSTTTPQRPPRHQVRAVVIGLEHFVRRYHTDSSNGSREESASEVRCQLCESTRRLLRAAREHKKRTAAEHDSRNCDACKMWATIKGEYTHLQRIKLATAAAMAVVPTCNSSCRTGDISRGSGTVEICANNVCKAVRFSPQVGVEQ